MLEKLGAFLLDLVDPEKKRAFLADPDEAMRMAGLTAREKSAVRRLLPRPAAPLRRGRLAVVGSGISIAQLTWESRIAIERADRVLYAVMDLASEAWIRAANPRSESLRVHYVEGRPREESYAAMVAHILGLVRQELDVCAVFYGHPGVFVGPSHEAIRQARAEGFAASMLPGISAADCMFADLGVDPAVNGCQMIEATELLTQGRQVDTFGSVVIWQVGAVGDQSHRKTGTSTGGYPVLLDYLARFYEPTQAMVMYAAPEYTIFAPEIVRTTLAELPGVPVSYRSTLYIPPRAQAPAHRELCARLGL